MTDKLELAVTQSDAAVLGEKGFVLEKIIGEGSYAKVGCLGSAISFWNFDMTLNGRYYGCRYFEQLTLSTRPGGLSWLAK